MTGPRGKACHTCRQRRVKCDETKPVCVRCAKGGFECMGYERKLQWVTASDGSSLPQEAIASGSHSQEIQLRPGTFHRRIQSPPAELNLSAFQHDFYYSSMFSNFVWRTYGVPWLQGAVEGTSGGLAQSATMVLAKSAFGRLNQDKKMHLEGAEQYGTCLSHLATRLGDVASLARGGSDLLITILVLIMHAAANSDREGCVSHLKGVAKLLYIQGPTRFQEQPYLNAFEAARATMIVGSLISKQRLFLEAESWRTIPWARNPQSKLPQSQLLDILVVIPGILQDHDLLNQAVVLRQDGLTELLKRTEIQLVKLYQWRWSWQANWGDQIGVDYDRTRELGAFGSRRSNHALRFSRFVFATDIMLYNATLMWLLGLLWKIDPTTADNRIQACAAAARPNTADALTTSFEPLCRPGATRTMRDPAVEICLTYEWVSRHHSRSKDPAFLYLFPMGMAMSVLQMDSDAMAWAKDLLKTSLVTADYAQGSNQLGFGFYVIKESVHPEQIRARERLFTPQELIQMA